VTRFVRILRGDNDKPWRNPLWAIAYCDPSYGDVLTTCDETYLASELIEGHGYVFTDAEPPLRTKLALQRYAAMALEE
jgi:hypothetical protein